jgi:UDPglucose 6-dehydrogenase
MLKNYKVAQIGNGFVGNALHESFKSLGVRSSVYDKFQKIGSVDCVVGADVIFLCLPTPYVEGAGFCLKAIEENLSRLKLLNYSGLCVIKSTVEPGVTRSLSEKYDLNIAHNPEFLTERTAFEDFHKQKHVVLGKVKDSSDFDSLILFYKKLYPDALISVCTSDESEAMKLFANAFYAQKVMIFNEFYSLCESIGLDYGRVRDLMLKNNWIAPHHVFVPGPDGRLAYGGHCFPKDTNALLRLMGEAGSPGDILKAVILERNRMREE